MVKTAAGILAGGKSSRMGKNKASLTWNGDTFLHTLIDACRDFPEIYVSVDDREKYRDLSCTLVEDEEKEYGPLEGIYQVLKQMDAPYAVMLATDMPMISREFLKALVSNITGEEDCLVLRREGRPQPLCSVYAKVFCLLWSICAETGSTSPDFCFSGSIHGIWIWRSWDSERRSLQM